MNRDMLRRGLITDRSANARLEEMIGEVLRLGTIASSAESIRAMHPFALGLAQPASKLTRSGWPF